MKNDAYTMIQSNEYMSASQQKYITKTEECDDVCIWE